MASLRKRPDGRWRARYRGPDQRERSKHFDRKVDAEKWLAGVSVSKDRGEWVDPSLSVVRLGEWSQQWLDGQTHLKPSTKTRYASLLATHVVPAFGNVRLSELRHAAIQTWVVEPHRQGPSRGHGTAGAPGAVPRLGLGRP